MSAHSGVRIVALALFVLLPATTFGQSVVGVLGIAAEVAPIEKRLQDSREITVQGYVFREGTLNGRRVVVGRSGCREGQCGDHRYAPDRSVQAVGHPVLRNRAEQSIRLCSLVMS